MAPRVFISYTHDSPEHEDHVWQLSERLRKNGVDCHVDLQQESPPEGWPRWCRNQIQEANFVLVVCTETYLRRYEGKGEVGKGRGGKWEGSVITQEIYDAEGRNTKFIPVVLASHDTPHTPVELHGATNYDLSKSDGYEKLLRRLSGQPLRKASDIGEIPLLPTLERMARRQSKQLFTLPHLADGTWSSQIGLRDETDTKGILQRLVGTGISKNIVSKIERHVDTARDSEFMQKRESVRHHLLIDTLQEYYRPSLGAAHSASGFDWYKVGPPGDPRFRLRS